ncbi:Cation_efflux family protein [Hexamita inflata]|uniref:Cation efflux family protein n=1 Tax=Hexamita inflata TaxID=28002 RepID=A0AA86PZ07_9EUKA|nr:Cation efflux family protein [Hexamita inflata]
MIGNQVSFVSNGIGEVGSQHFNTQDQETEYNIDLPKIPINFEHLTQGYQYQPQLKLECECDCGAQKVPYSQCPHFVDPAFRALFQMLENRLQHLDFVNISSKNDIKMKLFRQVISSLQRIPCLFNVEVNQTNKQNVILQIDNKQQKFPNRECHIYRELKRLFPIEYQNYFDNKVMFVQESKLIKLFIILSFSANILLFCLKFAVLLISKSLSILASTMDSAMDILCGFVLFLALKLAQRGIQKGMYQRILHENQTLVQYIYAQRYETIGVLIFSSIMATLAIVLFGESISYIVNISKGNIVSIQFGQFPMSIIGFTIILKLFLWCGCSLALKKGFNLSLQAYRDDHCNDTFTNIIGFGGAALTFYLKGNFIYCDPIASTILSIYIFVHWVLICVSQIKNLVGHKSCQNTLDEYICRLLHQFACSIFITEVQNLVSYSSGALNVIEIHIKVPCKISLVGAHSICQSIQNGFEVLDGVERCYVHIETEECTNIF